MCERGEMAFPLRRLWPLGAALAAVVLFIVAFLEGTDTIVELRKGETRLREMYGHVTVVKMQNEMKKRSRREGDEAEELRRTRKRRSGTLKTETGKGQEAQEGEEEGEEESGGRQEWDDGGVTHRNRDDAREQVDDHVEAEYHAVSPNDGDMGMRFPRDVSGTFKGSWRIADERYNHMGSDDGRASAAWSSTETNTNATTSLSVPIGFVSRNFGAVAFKLTSTDSTVDSMADVTGELVFRDGWSLGDMGYRMHVAGVYARDTGTITFSFESPGIAPLTDDEVREEGEEYRAALIQAAGDAVRGTLPAVVAANASTDDVGDENVNANAAATNVTATNADDVARSMLRKTCRYIARFQLHRWDFLGGTYEFNGYYPYSVASPAPAAYTHGHRKSNENTEGETTVMPDAATRFVGARKGTSQAFSINIPMNVTGTLTSSNCDDAPKMDANFRVVQFTEIYHKAMNYTLLVLAVSVVHVILISNQIQHSSSSQGAATKVSLASIAMHTLVDAYGCLIHFTGGIVIDPLFHPLVWTAFTKFIVFSAYELRFIMMLWKARNPNITDWHRARRELSNLYSRFYAVVLLGLVFMYQFSEYLRLFVLVVYSFWLPQVAYSIYANARRPMTPAFVIGSSLLRLVIPLYVYGYPGNFLGVDSNPRFCLTLSFWVLFQVMVMMTQHYYGPRCFVPAMFLPKRYNYFRPFKVGGGDSAKASDLESGETYVKTCHQVTECVICMSEVDMSKLSSRMITPCNHAFHTECLQKWMEVKLECPTCRQPLPVEE